MYSRYSRKDSNGDIAISIIALIVCFILYFSISSCSVNDSRSKRNMTPIKDGYVYDTNTKIIYIESFTGRYHDETVYTNYYDENGDMCRYLNGKWVPIRKE